MTTDFDYGPLSCCEVCRTSTEKLLLRLGHVGKNKECLCRALEAYYALTRFTIMRITDFCMT